KDMFGNPPFKAWREAHPKVQLGTHAQAAAFGDVIVNATSGHGALDALELAGAGADGKPVLDISNPLDFSKGMPPSLTVSNTDSLAEQLQRAHPKAKVVKALNTMNAYLMVDPAKLAGGDHTTFVAGDDAGAKATVTELLRSFGWKDVLD